MPPEYLSHPAFAENEGKPLANANRGARGVFTAGRAPTPAQVRERMRIIREHNMKQKTSNPAKAAPPERTPLVYSVEAIESLSEGDELA